MSTEKPEQHKQRARTETTKKAKQSTDREYSVSQSMEDAVGITVQNLSYLLRVEEVKGLGPQKFKSAFEAGLRPEDLLNNPKQLRIPGKRGEEIQRSLAQVADKDSAALITRAKRYIAQAYQYGAKIITYWHPLYPQIVFRSNYPTPILFARGTTELLITNKTVACVGSRKIRPPYSERHQEFAEVASRLGFTIVAGFALGADSIGHQAAVKAGGNTICVMAGGLDRPFPPENRSLWEDFLRSSGAVFVSEAPFGARAGGLTLRKRNKLIVAFSLGVLISQSREKGGTMNAYRFGLEQHKPIATFLDDGTEDSSGNKLISQSTKVLMATFDSKEPNRESWQRWLQQLSYSI